MASICTLTSWGLVSVSQPNLSNTPTSPQILICSSPVVLHHKALGQPHPTTEHSPGF